VLIYPLDADVSDVNLSVGCRCSLDADVAGRMLIYPLDAGRCRENAGGMCSIL
jgi:hypothetical protein